MPIQRTKKGNSDEILRRVSVLGYALEEASVEYGLRAQSEARVKHTYKDRTGCLTSSIGFAVARDAKVLAEGGGDNAGTYQVVLDGEKGVQAAKALAEAESSESNALQVVVFAGMPYGKKVEEYGYSVLEPAKLLLQNEFKAEIKEIIRKVAENGKI